MGTKLYFQWLDAENDLGSSAENVARALVSIALQQCRVCSKLIRGTS